MLVYDITAEKSFDNIKTWIRNIEQHASDDVEKMILGNKCDMAEKRVISEDQGKQVRCSPRYSFRVVYQLRVTHDGPRSQPEIVRMIVVSPSSL